MKLQNIREEEDVKKLLERISRQNSKEKEYNHIRLLNRNIGSWRTKEQCFHDDERKLSPTKNSVSSQTVM